MLSLFLLKSICNLILLMSFIIAYKRNADNFFYRMSLHLKDTNQKSFLYFTVSFSGFVYVTKKQGGTVLRLCRLAVMKSFYEISACFGKHPGFTVTYQLFLHRMILLNRICSVFCIRDGCVYLFLLCFTVFKEIRSNLREQCIRQYVFILLFPLFHLSFNLL